MRTSIYAFAAMTCLVMATPGLADHYYTEPHPAGQQHAGALLRPAADVHRGADGRFFCRHGDGTRGRVIGSFGGGDQGSDAGIRCQ
jgi:hypothetical protein